MILITTSTTRFCAELIIGIDKCTFTLSHFQIYFETFMIDIWISVETVRIIWNFFLLIWKNFWIKLWIVNWLSMNTELINTWSKFIIIDYFIFIDNSTKMLIVVSKVVVIKIFKIYWVILLIIFILKLIQILPQLSFLNRLNFFHVHIHSCFFV